MIHERGPMMEKTRAVFGSEGMQGGDGPPLKAHRNRGLYCAKMRLSRE